MTDPIDTDPLPDWTDQDCRAQAAAAIGWRHPSRHDSVGEHEAWWAALDDLAGWIRTGRWPS